MRLPRFLQYISLLTVSLFGGIQSSQAEPPVSLPVLSNLPACNVSPVAADKLSGFPCSVIVSGSSVQLDTVSIKPGLSTRARFSHVSAAAITVLNSQGMKQLVISGLDVIPDRIIAIDARPPGKGKGGGGGSSGQIVPDGVTRIGAAPGDLSLTGSGIGIAIVDTGIDLVNPDLNHGSDCFDAFSQGCGDANGHGTHVAGISAAKNNSIDVVGVAPDAIVYAVRVLDANGSGSDSSIMQGLEWIINNANVVTPAIRVANLSLGRPGNINDNPSMRSLFQTLEQMGVIVVVAAGNDSSLEAADQVPATYPEVISVASTTAVDGTNNRCRLFSGVIGVDSASYFTSDGAYNLSTGIGVSISAPGEQKEDISRGCGIKSSGILSLQVGGGTTRKGGTSMASPHVAGVVALMAEGAYASDTSTARSMLRNTAGGVGQAPHDSPTSGYSYDGEREGVVSACNLFGGNNCQ